MSALRNLVDKLKPTFTKGGKLGFLESTFDAFETFLFVPDTTTSKGAHIRDCNDMKRTMIMVCLLYTSRICRTDRPCQICQSVFRIGFGQIFGIGDPEPFGQRLLFG